MCYASVFTYMCVHVLCYTRVFIHMLKYMILLWYAQQTVFLLTYGMHHFTENDNICITSFNC